MRKLLSCGLSAEGVHEVIELAISVINNLQGQMNRSVSPLGWWHRCSTAGGELQLSSLLSV